LAVPDVVDGVPLADRVMAARCQAILHGDDGDTAAKRLLDLDERVRANLETTDAVEIAGLVEELLADLRRRRADTTTARLALTAGARLLADDRRAIDDLVSSVATCRTGDVPRRVTSRIAGSGARSTGAIDGPRHGHTVGGRYAGRLVRCLVRSTRHRRWCSTSGVVRSSLAR
jgi:hypothetical protein